MRRLLALVSGFGEKVWTSATTLFSKRVGAASYRGCRRRRPFCGFVRARRCGGRKLVMAVTGNKAINVGRPHALTRPPSLGAPSRRFRVFVPRPTRAVVPARRRVVCQLTDKGRSIGAQSIQVKSPLGEGSYGQVYEVRPASPPKYTSDSRVLRCNSVLEDSSARANLLHDLVEL